MTQENQHDTSNNSIVDEAVAQGGAYDIIRKRLLDHNSELKQHAKAINQARLDEFGQSDMGVTARVRIRTENNCIARDIVQVGDLLVFAYNVFIGLKKETKVDDVFSLFRVQRSGDSTALEAVSSQGTFLNETRFVNDFNELYRYYKHTKLIQLVYRDGKLLAGFQIGERLEDIRVFRWSVSPDGKTLEYIDNRGERDIKPPPAYDFEWLETSRDDSVNGRHPHINILDTVFVETVGGDVTIKIENNTEDGLGIYREPVEDKTQSLDDAKIEYAAVGNLILLKILPYREQVWRYFIYNRLQQTIIRIDALGQSCVQLPEDHGIIFPGGYYLQTGENKTFDDQLEGLSFKRIIRSPNGEDVLYVFYEPNEGVIGLFAYNLIEKKLQNPIYAHGYALAQDGQLIIFSAESEPTRVHPMQIWQTPYMSTEFASKVPVSQNFYGRIGNAELVRGISDIYSLCRLIDDPSVSMSLYERLSQASKKIVDDHYWLAEEETVNIKAVLNKVSTTSELVIDEFEKVESIRKQSTQAMFEANQNQQTLLQSIKPDNWTNAEEYVDALSSIRRQRGHLITIKDYRYIDLETIDDLEQELLNSEESLSEKTVTFLSNEEAFKPYLEKIQLIDKEAEAVKSNAALKPIIKTIEATAEGIDLLSELMTSLKLDDPTVRTRIIDSISEVYALLNQSKAKAKNKQKSLGSAESVAQFSAQFKLFNQSITNALGVATSPEKCEEQLSRLLVQLEELESQFSDFDQFLADIMAKRDEVYESFESHKQQLLDERQRKAQSINDAAERMLNSIEKRSLKFTEADDLNTYFASDNLVLKTKELVIRLRELDSSVNADAVESRFKAIKEQALRSLRDKSDIYEDGGSVIKLGPRHKFSVNTQELDLTIIPREGFLNVHLSGTNYYEVIEHKDLMALKDYWDLAIESETQDVYRGEYLAASIIYAADHNEENISWDDLKNSLLDKQKLMDLVRTFASPRYKEAYEKGIHDHDACLLLEALIPALGRADLLKYDPESRALAQIFWANLHLPNSKIKLESEPQDISHITWPERAQSAVQMKALFASNRAEQLLSEEIEQGLVKFNEIHKLPVSRLNIEHAAQYLLAELSQEHIEFITSKYAVRLVDEFKACMDDNSWRGYQTALTKLLGWPGERWQLTTAWLNALVEGKKLDALKRYIPEAVALINAEQRIDRRYTEVDLALSVEGLLGDHPLLKNTRLDFTLDEFLQRMQAHRFKTLPAYRQYLQIRQQIIESQREGLRLHEFKARPLSSFVRNRLINESYLPLIGDNLAKQMGTIGEGKRSDLMGLLMMISPPGYGKTTLMEYVANRLGLIFMKINCPSLGHDVLSLDPSQAPNATAKQELLKLNLALEMGNNVMLYLDDIQHTHPEFLQKFISLCDGTRRIEGIWKDKTKTYDMRGKKFCVVMAGNPYTESGEAFKIPDMLANRADIYNLGDILGGMDEQFALSYIENSLTSNPVLAPLAVREMADVYKLIQLAQGVNIATTDLSHPYSGAEINEICEVFKKMFIVRDVVLKINQQYIASAAQDDKYRIEPAFKLQGSYRNMNKMTEKISAVMNEEELMQMIADHYLGEAQLLTTGAEDNLLKLAELRGNMNPEQETRWQQIKADFLKNKAMGGDDTDTGTKVVSQLIDVVNSIKALGGVAEQQAKSHNDIAIASIDKLNTGISHLSDSIQNNQPNVEVINQSSVQLDELLHTLSSAVKDDILPLINNMDSKLEFSLKTQQKITFLYQRLRKLEAKTKALNKTSV